MLYFAYCTLLDRGEMARLAPGAVQREVGRISGWRVTFAAYAAGRGGCQLSAEPEHDVWGVLYELSDGDLTGLDQLSGVDRGFYQRLEVEVRTAGGVVPAVTYIIPSPRGLFRPSDDYVRPILAGARALHLPTAYLAELEAAVAAALV